METNFFFYTNYVEWGKAGLTESQYYMYLVAILYYGTTGTCEISDPAVEAVFIQAKYSIDATKKRYNRAKKNGAKGGRPGKSWPHVRLFAADMSAPHMHIDVTTEYLAKEFNCSKRTIQRHCPKEFLEMLAKNKEGREDYSRIYDNGYLRYKALGLSRCKFLEGIGEVDRYQILYLDTLKSDVCLGMDVEELTKGRPYTRLRIRSCSEGERWAERIKDNILRTKKTPYGDTVEIMENPEGGYFVKVVAKAGEENDDVETGVVKDNAIERRSAGKITVPKVEVKKAENHRYYALYDVKEREVTFYTTYKEPIAKKMGFGRFFFQMVETLSEGKAWIDALLISEADTPQPCWWAIKWPTGVKLGGEWSTLPVEFSGSANEFPCWYLSACLPASGNSFQPSDFCESAMKT